MPDLSVIHQGMIHLKGGTFAMGSDRFHPEEAPVRRARVEPFAIDETPVTNTDSQHVVQLSLYHLVLHAGSASVSKTWQHILRAFDTRATQDHTSVKITGERACGSRP